MEEESWVPIQLAKKPLEKSLEKPLEKPELIKGRMAAWQEVQPHAAILQHH